MKYAIAVGHAASNLCKMLLLGVNSVAFSLLNKAALYFGMPSRKLEMQASLREHFTYCFNKLLFMPRGAIKLPARH